LARRFYARDVLAVAQELLNKVLVAGSCAGRIIEVEAYRQDDPASHSFRGRTARNAVMFGPPGHLYVYFTYGMHWCANVVTGPAGEGSAVLIRAVEPIRGLEIMRERRPGRADRELAGGPAKLCAAFGLTRADDGRDLVADPVVGVFDDGTAPPGEPDVTTRIGITKAATLPWRFAVPSHPGVSRGRRAV
jgi:DNA-3-methyladenine glycosylase